MRHPGCKAASPSRAGSRHCCSPKPIRGRSPADTERKPRLADSTWAYSTAGFDRSVHRIDGIESVVYAIGEGPPVVYFHGGGTFHGFEWAREFADKFRMILPPPPGFGESGDADFTGLDDYLLLYYMLFAALKLEQFDLIVASMGLDMGARGAGERRGGGGK